MFAASLRTKQPLPRDLPDLLKHRESLYRNFFAEAQTTPKPRLRQMIRNESWIRFYSFVLSLRGVTTELHAMGPRFKRLYGELAPPVHGLGSEGYDAGDLVSAEFRAPHAQPPPDAESVTTATEPDRASGESTPESEDIDPDESFGEMIEQLVDLGEHSEHDGDSSRSEGGTAADA
ncbi:hypothetical protein BDK51DRAFT_25948 [Blyttiomyces helicus]|uniref:Uncharacterized protein n=1 Tax=Blyttiomyces helicus TaxID=388810 RepID=A0A4P9VXJ9_9FUNG|nr:hypothetical protein BDK51DRAFT_25948 [Blyttiomyces helicus]|eukprot:RKO83008.1 hypothetical protein BDK51DRAFT_25948 [Blyttiomyces helicus]